MKHNQSSEDYLEAILLLSQELEFVHQIEVARKLNVSQPAVQKALKILRSNGYITTDGLHIYLTEQGKTYAQDIYHRHCTIRTFLTLHGVGEQDADYDACEMEHALSPATFAMMEEYVTKNSSQN
jgi:Mn-dependent DtxR family transcriptional regulator